MQSGMISSITDENIEYLIPHIPPCNVNRDQTEGHLSHYTDKEALRYTTADSQVMGQKYKSPLHPNKLHCLEWHVGDGIEFFKVIKETHKPGSEARQWRTGGKDADWARETGKRKEKQ